MVIVDVFFRFLPFQSIAMRNVQILPELIHKSLSALRLLRRKFHRSLLWTPELGVGKESLVIFSPSPTYTSMENVPFHLRAKAAIATLQNCRVIFFLCLTMSSFSIWNFPSNHQLTSHWMQPNLKANPKTHYDKSWHPYLPRYFSCEKRGNLYTASVSLSCLGALLSPHKLFLRHEHLKG